MNSNALPLMTTEGLVVASLYLATLLVLGWLGRAARKEDSLADFYLGGRGLGLVVLLLTLYATQYSGNTLIGFAAQAYRDGFTFLVSVTFMMGVVAVYLLYAPKLHRVSHQRHYITVSDYVQDRFGSRPLSVLVSLSGIIALANYILTNLKAIGYAAEAATGGTVSIAQGIVGLAFIIVIYETLGGLRSVAWTDVIQGLILLAGCVVICITVVSQFEGFEAMLEAIRQARPQFWAAPGLDDCLLWLSTLVVVSLGIALYPHAVQRIYAARNPVTLRRALQVMIFLPLFTTLFMVMVGLAGAAVFPNLSKQESEGITLLMLENLARNSPGISWVILLFLAAVFAAIMSTIDSALLSISSMITQDLYKPLRPEASQAHLTRVGKVLSWAVMGGAVVLAIELPQTIWRMIEIKLELLMQIAPALLLGLHLPRLRTGPVLWGFVVGTAVTLFCTVGNFFNSGIPAKPWGIHAGLLGLALNLATLLVLETVESQPNARLRTR